MRRLLVLTLVLVPALAAGTEAVVTKVINGDTIEAGGQRVRLQGIDASSARHGPRIGACGAPPTRSGPGSGATGRAQGPTGTARISRARRRRNGSTSGTSPVIRTGWTATGAAWLANRCRRAGLQAALFLARKCFGVRSNPASMWMGRSSRCRPRPSVLGTYPCQAVLL